METIHSQKSWYKGKKKPRLQIKILHEILTHGKLSKIEFERLYRGIHYHADIISGFDNLKKHDLIEESDKRIHRGRIEVLYSLTTKGLLALISENPEPRNFWNSLVLWVYYQKNPISWHDILESFDFYLKMYLKHNLKDGYYSVQLDEFNITCDTWFKKAIVHVTNIPPAQKVLEILATNPDLRLEQISNAIGEKVGTIESILMMYTQIRHEPVLVDVYGHHSTPFYPRGWRFQIHNAIMQSPSKGKFRLTVFGVLMVLYIILKNHEGKLPHGLMNEIAIKQYFNKIAFNYKAKIPVLFEKWQILTSSFMDYSYLNFKIILDKTLRDKIYTGSVIDGGNRELLLGMREIVLASQRQLIELQRGGMDVIFNFHHTVQNESTFEAVWEKIQPCFQLFLYLTAIINPTDYDPESFISKYGNVKYLDRRLVKKIGSIYGIHHLEKSFSFEISFIYYFGIMSEMWTHEKFSPENLKLIFKKIVNSDKEIGEFIHQNIGMIQKYYRDVHHAIGTISSISQG